jgi:hypothetical protein
MMNDAITVILRSQLRGHRLTSREEDARATASQDEHDCIGRCPSLASRHFDIPAARHIIALVRRLPVTRLLTAVWSLWLGALLVEPAGLHSCSISAAHAARLASSAGHDMAGATASHAAHTGGRAPAPHDACACLGACCCAPAASVPSGPLLHAPVARLVVIRALELSDAAEAVCPTPRYAHPFANGPPAQF